MTGLPTRQSVSTWVPNMFSSMAAGSSRATATRSKATRAAITSQMCRRYSGFAVSFCMNAVIMSTGTGKMVTELFSVAISASVCR